MKTLTEPIHKGTINGKTVRFFRSPLQGPHMPWHSHDDMLACLNLPRELRRHFHRMLVNHWKNDIRTVATADGIVTIAPHYVAQGLIGAAVDAHMSGSATLVEREYPRAAADAMNVITGDLGPQASINYFLEAFHNN